MPTSRRWDALVLALGHAMTDFYPSFLAPLLPIFVAKMGLSLTLAGGLATAQGFTTSLIQPLFGYAADRIQKPQLVGWGLLSAAILTSIWGFAPNGLWLTAMVILAGLGVALFHPIAGGLISQVGREKRGLGMSLFITGGTAGYAIGPLVAVALASRWGVSGILPAMIPGLLVSFFLIRFAWPKAPRVASSGRTSLGTLVLKQLRPMWLLIFIGLVRSSLMVTLGTFLPLYLVKAGFPLVLAGLGVSLFRAGGSLGGLAGGPLSDRIGRKPIMILSFLLALPFLWAFFRTGGWVALGFLAVAGAIITSTVPVNILMGQELVPENPAMVSGLIMGFAWGLGELVLPLVGWWADRSGLPVALSGSVLAAGVVAVVAACFLRPVPTQAEPHHST